MRFGLAVSIALCSVGLASVSQAASGSAGVSDQKNWQAGSSVVHAGQLSACPRELREIYRGNLYCRQPVYETLARRHAACPEGFWGFYRGDQYCFGRR